MFASLRQHVDSLLRRAKLKPLSLAEKCRLQFGAAVLLIIALALMMPYYWMGKLVEKSPLDAGSAIADTVFEKHFNIENTSGKTLPMLKESGVDKDPNSITAKWVRLDSSGKLLPSVKLNEKQSEIIDQLIVDEKKIERGWIDETRAISQNNYIRLVRAGDSCIRCHHSQGSGGAFNRNQPIGAIVVSTPARQIANTRLMNFLLIMIAGLLAAIGAMIAFYTIAQRIILRPIRQLRALVSNIAEGNLDARSSIKSDDEYEKLSNGFNEMLDGLQESQEKLRQANKTLDAKIAQLSDRNIELFKANKLKSEFLANMSHEFRTPLNSILGFAQLLKEKPADNAEKSQRWAENIITSGRSLLNMINDLLELAKAEAGKITLRIEKTSISQLCTGLSAFFLPMTEQRGIEFVYSVADDIPIIMTDNGKVQQILYNLLSNAIKFAPDNGKVQVEASMLDDATVRIAVSDSGPGVAEEEHDKIFEKFRQGDGSITRQTDGTGLGLAICKELAHLLAGSVSLDKDCTEGATFYLDIPTTLQSQEEDQVEQTNNQ